MSNEAKIGIIPEKHNAMYAKVIKKTAGLIRDKKYLPLFCEMNLFIQKQFIHLYIHERVPAPIKSRDSFFLYAVFHL